MIYYEELYFLIKDSGRRKLHGKFRNSPCDFDQLFLNKPDDSHQKEYTFFSLLNVHLQAKNDLLLIKKKPVKIVTVSINTVKKTFQTTLTSWKCVKHSFCAIFITTEPCWEPSGLSLRICAYLVITGPQPIQGIFQISFFLLYLPACI